MSMDAASWRRHANPWSVYSRMTILPLLALAVWSRIWIGGWSVAAVVAVIAWTWLNPRLFPAPERMDTWAAKVVQGERIWLQGAPEVVAIRHRRAVAVLAGASLIGLCLLGWGLITLHVWATILGIAIAAGAKLWLADRMSFVCDAVNRQVERESVQPPSP